LAITLGILGGGGGGGGGATSELESDSYCCELTCGIEKIINRPQADWNWAAGN